MNSNLAYRDEFFQDEPWEELIDGKVVLMSPRPKTAHNTICFNLCYLLKRYFRGKPCRPFGDGEDLYLSEQNRFVPDAMVVCDREKIRERGVYGAPDLVVEILSLSTAKRDRGCKFDAYEKAGVREYWIIDPKSRMLEDYRLQDGKFFLHDVYAHHTPAELADMTDEELAAVVTEFPCGIFPDFVIKLEEVFEDV